MVRIHAAAALAELGDNRAVSVLIDALNDSDEVVRLRSAAALFKVGGKDAIPSAIMNFKDKELSRQLRTVKILGKRGDDAISALVEIIGDDEHNIKTRLHAVAALIKASQ